MKENIHVWLDQIEREAIVPQRIIALNFGLYETEKGFCIYLVGACNYDEDDDSWAEEVENVPREFFLEIVTQCDWQDFQEQTARILTDELKQRSINPLSPFHNMIITTGFDDGNLIRIM
ncbi:MAG: hypothetical protein IKQ51_01360 [Bacteroidaceae bacterium]|nr:hypothetical protein [Bacteroidaceae bacterium]